MTRNRRTPVHYKSVNWKTVSSSDDLNLKDPIFTEQFGSLFKAFTKARIDTNTAVNTLAEIQALIQYIRDIMSLKDDQQIASSVVSRLESLLIVILDCSSRESLADMFLPMLQYLKTWAPNDSIILKFSVLLKKILMEDKRSNPIELTQQGGWFGENWENVVQGQFGQRLAGAINLLIIAGVLPEETNNKMTDNLYSIIHVQAMRKSHPSIFHHLFHTIDWVVDSVIPAIRTGDASLLLYNSDAKELDELYRICLQLAHFNTTGQMELAMEKHGIQDEAALMVYLINTSAAHMTVKHRALKGSPLDKEYSLRLIKLDKLQGDITAGWHAMNMREKPYATLFRGPSSVGKSTLASISQHAICRANEFPEGEEFSCTINGSDKYQSEFRSQHVCVIFDDIGNTKPEKCADNPLFILIQFINNMHCSALSPIAEKKGTNDIRTRVVIGTTNTEDLHASFFSVNPASIMRRFDLIVDVELSKGCAGEGGGLHPKFAGQTYPNAWDLSLKTVVITRSASNSLADQYECVEFKKTNIIGLIDYLEEQTPKHFAIQKRIVESSSSLHEVEHCTKHNLFTMPCVKCSLTNQSGTFKDMFMPKRDNSSLLAPDVEETDPKPLDSLQQLMEPIPEEPSEPNFLARMCGAKTAEPEQPEEENPMFFMPVPGAAHRLNTPDPVEALKHHYNDKLSLESHHAPTLYIKESSQTFAERIKSIFDEGYQDTPSLLKQASTIVEENPWTSALALFAAVGLAGLAVHKLTSDPVIDDQGAVFSRIQKASRQPSQFIEKDNVYQKIHSNNNPQPKGSVSSSWSQLESKIDKNLHYVCIQEVDPITDNFCGKPCWGNAFPCGGGDWILIGHQVKGFANKCFQIDFQTHPGVGIKKFSALLTGANTRAIDGTDAVIANIPSGGDTADFSKYMLDTLDGYEYRKNDPVFVYHVHRAVVEGDVDTYVPPSRYSMTGKIVKVDTMSINNAPSRDVLTYTGDNHSGMCGSLVFAGGRNPVLLGVHCAGNIENRLCAATLVAKDMLVKREGVVFTETADMPTEVMGVPLTISNDVHAHSPIHYLESDEHNVEIIGQHGIPTSKFRSDMIDSPMVASMETHMGYEKTHGPPPKGGASFSRRKHLVDTSIAMKPINPTYMMQAKDDFKAKLEPLVSKDLYCDLVHPISYEDACSGVPGVHGFDPINPKTSMGFPLNAPKWKFFKENDADEIYGLQTVKFVTKTVKDGKDVYSYDIVFDPDKADVQLETDKLLQWMVDGKRANVIFRANLKDEAVTFKKIEANKIRVFAGAPVCLVIATRMLTLPLIHMMTYFPEEFESAVGVDATGRDWAKIKDIITEWGDEKCGDGDFSSFDTKIRPEVSAAAFDILKWLLERAGFDEEMLAAFDGIATECMFPIYESDGVLYKIFGSNPSGHSLTVIINGLCNSLYLRYAYYAMYAGTTPPLFHKRVKLVTFGDDGIFGIHPEEKKFGMSSIYTQLIRIDVKYTDANKNIPSDLAKHIKLCGFLKRNFEVHPTLGEVVGAIEPASIWKSLAMAHKPKKGQQYSTAQICAGNLNGALRELFFHSEEEYDKHLPIFKRIAAESVDAEGICVEKFFREPLTKQEIIDSFHNTTTSYDLAKSKMYNQAGGMQYDYRDDIITLNNEIEDEAVAIFARRNILRTRGECVQYIWNNCLGPCFLPTLGDVAAANVMRYIQWDRVETQLSHDVNSQIYSYLTGGMTYDQRYEGWVSDNLDEQILYQHHQVWVTANFEEAYYLLAVYQLELLEF